MTWFLRHALIGLLTIWLVASVVFLLVGIGFAGSVHALVWPPEGDGMNAWITNWLLILAPWMIAGIVWSKARSDA